MRKARVWGWSLYEAEIQESGVYEIYTTEEATNLDTEKNVDYYRSLETCGLDIVGWVKAEEDEGVMFTQVYEDEVEWLGDNEE